MNQLSQRLFMPKSRSLNPLLNRKQPHLRPEEITTLAAPLFELLPQAALLIDLEEERVLLCNTAALRMTAYSRMELVSLEIDRLFPIEKHAESRHFLDFEVAELGHPFQCEIILRGGSALPVEVSPAIMDTVLQPGLASLQPTGTAVNTAGRGPRYLALHIEPLEEVERRQQSHSRREQRRENLSRLTNSLAEVFRCPDESCKINAMEAALCHIARLSGLDAIAVYWWEAGSGDGSVQSPGIPFLAAWTDENRRLPFPQALSLAEIQAVRTPTRWSKGKRLTFPLQQKLRSAGFGFSELIPLNTVPSQPASRNANQTAREYQKNVTSPPPVQIAGLLAGVANTKPDEESLTSLQMAASLVAQVLMFKARQDALQNALMRLNEANALTDYVKESLFDCILILDPDLRIIDANQAALDMLEYKRHEIIGQEIGKVLISDQSFSTRVGASMASEGATTDGQALFLEQMREVIRRSMPTEPQQLKLFRRAGTSFLANYRLVPVNRIDPKSGLLLVLQDLSEVEFFRKENEQLTQRAYLGEITSSFAHEIRNPINSLSSGVQLLLATTPKEFPDRQVLEDLEIDLERLTRIVDSGLAFFRKKEYKMEPIRIDRLVNRLRSSAWQHRLHRYNTKIEILINGELPAIQGDENALEHVFTNLFDNAIDAMSDNPPNQPRNIIIKLSTIKNEHDQELLETWVSDTGPGIADALVERIFDPFFTTKAKGTGVGLSIVRRIISAHGGTIAITHNVGGTTFRLCLPLPRRTTENGIVITTAD